MSDARREPTDAERMAWELCAADVGGCPCQGDYLILGEIHVCSDELAAAKRAIELGAKLPEDAP